ncbi:MAG: EVE domain-containing protein [Zavarzinella sp.]
MKRWLCKQEPDCYSWTQLEEDGQTVWDGVNNALALSHMRSMKAGDIILFYHSGKEKAIVGEMEVVSMTLEDPENPKSRPLVEVKPLKKWPIPLTLKQMKECEDLHEWELIRISRLSVMPVSAAHWKLISGLVKQLQAEAKAKKK